MTTASIIDALSLLIMTAITVYINPSDTVPLHTKIATVKIKVMQWPQYLCLVPLLLHQSCKEPSKMLQSPNKSFSTARTQGSGGLRAEGVKSWPWRSRHSAASGANGQESMAASGDPGISLNMAPRAKPDGMQQEPRGTTTKICFTTRRQEPREQRAEPGTQVIAGPMGLMTAHVTGFWSKGRK